MALNVPFEMPAGVILPYAGIMPPNGWLFMDGREVFRNDYVALFNAIGENYGAGDGVSTFNLPDARGRSLFGRDNMNGVAANRLTVGNGFNGAVLGNAGGAQVVTLSEAQMPNHTHEVGGGGAFTALSGGGVVPRADSKASGAKGSSAAHSNMPPAIIVNYIIKT